MGHQVSPLLETDGVETDRVGCRKNEDGTLFCTIYSGREEYYGKKFEKIVQHGTAQRGSHHGSQENPHLEIEFDEDTRCVADDVVLICRRDRRSEILSSRTSE